MADASAVIFVGTKTPPQVEGVSRPRREPIDDRFDTTNLTKDLARRTIRGGAVTLTAQGAKFVLRMGSMAVLARLLTPADFGLIAMVTVVTGFIETFKDAGLSTATVQRATITHSQVSTLFWINIALSIGVMAVVAALAPAIAWFYGDPRLTTVTLALSGTMVFGGIAVQPLALLRRQMQFGRLAAIEIAGLVAGIATACVMAVQDFGYWSLVGMTVGSAAMTAVLSLVLSGWWPGLPRRGTGVRSMLVFGSHLAGANTFNYLTRNADNLAIGFFHGASALGVYSRGYNLFLVPLSQFLSPISAVAVPALSRTTNRPDVFRRLLLQKSYFVVFCVVLATGYSFCAAPELVQIVLGPGWQDAVTIVRILAIGGAVYGTNVAGSWVCTTHGWTSRQLRIAVIAGPTYGLSYLIGAPFGPVGVACGFTATCCLLRYPVFKYLLADSPISPGDLIRPLVRVGVIAAVAALTAMAAASHVPSTSLESLMVKSIAYAAIVANMCLVGILTLPRLDQGSERDAV